MGLGQWRITYPGLRGKFLRIPNTAEKLINRNLKLKEKSLKTPKMLMVRACGTGYDVSFVYLL